MYSTWMFNLIFSFIGLTVYFTIAFFYQTLQRAIIEALLAGIMIFLISYLFRWAIHYIMQEHSTKDMIETNDVSINNEIQDPVPLPKDTEINLEDGQIALASEYIKNLIND
ncbi:hypothetical protein SM124_17220 [Bacillus sp. 31A1R]|uniref:Uncharacterized protein n=1 Tax=Robertmurraya mangrovi TaxID=3098077 RepID=A0ABU5J206_9BACI|nr:hypothetical protein [Bacillus sp. 31A1R]MDZ5473457.1 hypothetical protein [Bacillus sp. 31A1R]